MLAAGGFQSHQSFDFHQSVLHVSTVSTNCATQAAAPALCVTLSAGGFLETGPCFNVFFSVASPTSKWFQRQSSESFRSFTSRSVGLTRTLRCTNPLLFFATPPFDCFKVCQSCGYNLHSIRRSGSISYIDYAISSGIPKSSARHGCRHVCYSWCDRWLRGSLGNVV